MPTDLLAFEDAVARVLAETPRLGVERLGLLDAAGAVLAAEVVAPRDVPHESASLMDGYAVRAAEAGAGVTLRIAYEIPAGRAAPRPLGAGECARIFTGAPLPPGADAVVMQEQVRRDGEQVVLSGSSTPGEHVRSAGSDARTGDVLVPAGTRLDAGSIALAGSMGHAQLLAGRAPTVAILATGDELRVAGEPLGPGQIYESNTFGLALQARDAGARPVVLGVAPDRPEEILARVRGAAADVIVTSGGASVGDYDFARDVLARLGGRTVFWGVAIRPGKPVLFGVIDRGPFPPALFFALPGNPAASALTFDLFVRPALLAMQGATRTRRPRLTAVLGKSLKLLANLTFLARGGLTSRAGRLTFEPASLQGSMSIRSLGGLGAVAIVPPGTGALEPGALVDVEPWTTPDAG